MIVWVASYPKSGNTFLRILLSDYLYGDLNSVFDFSNLSKIEMFPNLFRYNPLLDEKIINDIKEVKKVDYIYRYSLFLQKKLFSNGTHFLKTHSSNFNINKNVFTNHEITSCALYIVRDPRNVVSSYANFLSCSDEKSASIMIEELSRGGNLNLPRKDADRTKVWMGTWASNFNSWKPFKNQNRYLLVKYEELINKPEKTFLKILGFIHRLGKSKPLINQTKLENTIRTTSFDNLKNLEKKNGFPEAPHKNNKKNTPFFHKGPERNWKVTLEISIKNKIETAFKKEMMELGYL